MRKTLQSGQREQFELSTYNQTVLIQAIGVPPADPSEDGYFGDGGVVAVSRNADVELDGDEGGALLGPQDSIQMSGARSDIYMIADTDGFEVVVETF